MNFGNYREPATDRIKSIVQTGSSIRGTIRYCEYYKHCQKTPCPIANVAKNHDFNLNLSIPHGMNALFQYRHPVPAIISWYRMEVRKGFLIDKPSVWEEWWHKQLSYWLALMGKWYDNKAVTYCIDYDVLIQKPLQTTRSVLEVLAPKKIDDIFLRRAVSSKKIERKSNIHQSVYLRTLCIPDIEKKIDMARYKIPTLLPS